MLWSRETTTAGVRGGAETGCFSHASLQARCLVTAVPPDGTRHNGPPDLAVEVRSPGTWHRDIGRKLQRYRDAGTRELWLVDAPASTVLVYRVDAFAEAVEVGPGEVLGTPLLPGFALPIDQLFAD